MNKIKTAVLACTGLVGRQFVRLLDDHPYFELSCLTASPRSSGRRYGETIVDGSDPAVSEKTNSLLIRENTAAVVRQSGARVVFSALPASVAAELELELRKEGLFVFSNASSHRMDANVPLLIPEVNAAHLELAEEQLREFPGFIVANPNCVVAGLALVLKPLMAFGMSSATVTTFQAVSGGGRRGVAAWDILGNVIPFIAGEEEKIVAETGKILGIRTEAGILGGDLEIYPSCSRVAVSAGHLQSVSVEFRQAACGKAIAASLAAFGGAGQRRDLPTAPRRPLLLHESADRPQPRLDVDAGEPERARGMAVSVGRLRVRGKRCDFFLLVNNTVRGAAGGSVLNAELAFSQGLLAGAQHE